MKAYKLTDENSQTRNNTQWGENVTHSISNNSSNELCSSSWIHFYTSPLIAVLMNPAHANFQLPQLWECETSGEHLHEPLKSGCKVLTTLKQIPLPSFTAQQRVKFAILCGKEVYKDTRWNKWADDWLNGKDRSKEAAAAAYAAAYADVAAAYAAAYAADAAAYAADVAAYAADVAAADTAAAYAAAYAADVAAAYAAADTAAADAAADAARSQHIDFHALALLAATDGEN